MTLLWTYPVFTIQTTVSAISSGFPSLPIGISTKAQGQQGIVITSLVLTGRELRG